ncbi:MAG: nuclear transport factor 2 family protein [Gammaproteobacteria bacterium]
MRSAAAIFDHHLEVFAAGDLEGILSDYAPDAVMIHGAQAWHGIDGARRFFTRWLDELLPAGCRFDLIDRTVTDDMVFISWRAESARYRFDFGTDTFVMRDDRIWRQTVATVEQRK